MYKRQNIDSSDSMNSVQFIQNGIDVRTVYAMKDPKWSFYENGIVQWFEDEMCIRDRL